MRADVVVVGGAVGGMSAALLLAELGASVTLLERVPEPAAVGAGILLQPNGLAVLAALSLADTLNASGHRMSDGAIRSVSGRPITTVAIRDYGPGFGHVLAVRRSRLMEVLVEAVDAHPGIDVRFGTEVTSARPDGTVDVRSDSGVSSIKTDLVVGADGVGSTVRAGGDFGSRVQPTGVAYVRGLVDAAEVGLEGEYWTPLGLFGGAPMNDGSTYFYAAADAEPVAAAIATQDLRRFCALWTDALPLAAPVLGRLTSFDQLLVNEVVRVDCDGWSDGRLVLVGDAAHAMAPTLGQGANSALLDAAVLATELAAESAGTLSQGLARYEVRRKPRVRRVQNQADRLARLAGPHSKPICRVRDGAWVSARESPSGGHEMRRPLRQLPPHPHPY
ncbi:MAG TPA: NAD(P)/FAD-dependent oxidoreductase [Jiangellaceae bacterium]|nr:NAD(P)/FAD-dependent oxidoreductase [Jiangellaceae bacterium]